MTAGKVSLFIKSLLLIGMALAMTACVPKNLLKVSSEQAHQEAVETVDNLDAELSMDRDLWQASQSPSSIVGSDNVSVSAMVSHEDFGSALELSEEDYSLLPAGLLMLEGPDALYAPSFAALESREVDKKTPPLGSAEAKALAAFNTRQLLCRPGDRICMTSPYGVRRGKRIHKGIDIRAPLGSPIMAFKGGVVTRAGYNRSYGYVVDIQQDDGLVARYAHMSQILTRKGARVTKGLRIGRIGSTGRSTGPHLHFELIHNNRQTNPMVFIHDLDQLVRQGDEHDLAAARKALAKSGPHKKARRSKGVRKYRGPVKPMPATYKVKNGDTLWDIARAYGTSVKAIQAANGGNLTTLRPGRTIRMPKK